MTYSLWNRSVREYPTMHYFRNPMHIRSLIAFKILTKQYREFQSKICIARILSTCHIHIPTSNNPVRLHSLRVLPLPKLVRYFTSLCAQKIKNFLSPPLIYKEFKASNQFSFCDKHILVYQTDKLRYKVSLTDALPLQLRSKEKLSTFKSLLYDHILST